MVKSVDTLDSKSSPARGDGSSPSRGTTATSMTSFLIPLILTIIFWFGVYLYFQVPAVQPYLTVLFLIIVALVSISDTFFRGDKKDA